MKTLSSEWTESWTSQKASIFQEWIKINPYTEQRTSPCTTILVCIVQVHESVLLWKRGHNRDQYLQFVWYFQTLSNLCFICLFLGVFVTFHSQTSLIKTHIFTIIPCTGQFMCGDPWAHNIVNPMTGCTSLVNFGLLQVKRRPGMLCRKYQRLLHTLLTSPFQVPEEAAQR